MQRRLEPSSHTRSEEPRPCRHPWPAGASRGCLTGCLPQLSPVGLRWVWTLVMYTFVYVLTVEAKLRLAAAPPAPRGAGGGGWV